MRIKRIILENKTDTSVLGRDLCNIIIPEKYLSHSGLFKTAYKIQRGALSASGRPQQTYKCTVFYGIVEIFYRDNILGMLFITAGKFFGKVLKYYFHFDLSDPDLSR